MKTCCFQCVKGNKFESDSQQSIIINCVVLGCFQCVKGGHLDIWGDEMS